MKNTLKFIIVIVLSYLMAPVIIVTNMLIGQLSNDTILFYSFSLIPPIFAGLFLGLFQVAGSTIKWITLTSVLVGFGYWTFVMKFLSFVDGEGTYRPQNGPVNMYLWVILPLSWLLLPLVGYSLIKLIEMAIKRS